MDTGQNQATHGTSTLRVSIWRSWHLGALVAHLFLSLFFTWPLALNFLPGNTGRVPGFIREDIDQNLWNLWWVRQAVTGGHNPFVTDVIWYPTPVSLYYHTLNVFNGLVTIPFQPFLPLTAVYNLVVLVSFVLTGYGAFLLVHFLCGNRWAALVGSVAFAYSAYHLATMRGLLQLVSLEWVPFFLLFLLRAVSAPPASGRSELAKWVVAHALPAAVCLFLVTLVDWYYTMYALMLAGLLALYVPLRFAFSRRAGVDITARDHLFVPLVRLLACIALYAVLASPLLVPTFAELRSTNYMLPAPEAATQHSADLLAFFQPPRGSRILGGLSANRNEWPYGADTYEVYLTYTVLVLAASALLLTKQLRPALGEKDERTAPPSVKWLPGKWFWSACSVTFFLLALGPVLQVNGALVRWLPMPYALLEKVPVLNISRSPDRFAMPMMLALSVLAGYGVNTLAGKARAGKSRLQAAPAIALGALALTVIELFPLPYPQLRIAVPEWYSQLASEQGAFSILELPPQDDYWHGAYRMLYQTTHGKPIYGGYISREYPHPFLERTPGYMELTSTAGLPDMLATGRDEWLSAFAQYDLRYIVLEKQRDPAYPSADLPALNVDSSRGAVRSVLGSAAPVHSDEQLEVYGVPRPERAVPFLSIGDGWQPRETGPNGSFRWMGERAMLRIDAPAASDAYLVFKATSLGPSRRLLIYHGDTLVFDGGIGGLAEHRTSGPLGLPAGHSALTFVSPGGTTSPAELGMGGDLRQLSMAVLAVRLEPVEK